MSATEHVVAFYSRHPISGEQILARLLQSRGNLERLRPEELFPHDQDHYGGLPANDILAERAGITAATEVVDFCAGLGGPARYMAERHGARVICIELNPGRAGTAADLTRRVGLSDRVRVLRGNVMQVPLAASSMDVVMSQEALLHVPDKAAVLAEAFRILRPGGRIAFTDWVSHAALAPDDAESMWQGIAAQTLQSLEGYGDLLRRTGFDVLAAEDLTADWAGILAERFAMYRRLREETSRAGLAAGDDAFYRSYRRLVDLVQRGVLGGGRFTAGKPARHGPP